LSLLPAPTSVAAFALEPPSAAPRAETALHKMLRRFMAISLDWPDFAEAYHL
jgi:hypothetical protein